jgi:hypothetical protein
MTSTVESLAEAVAEWFPELNGRSIAVSEVAPFREAAHVPTLPVCATAMLNGAGVQAKTGGKLELSDTLVTLFAFEPVKYKNAEQQDTPFYAFYDYEPIRDTMIEKLRSWRTPRNGQLRYLSIDVDANEFAVYIAITLGLYEEWCPPKVKGQSFTIGTSLKPSAVPCPGTDECKTT